MRGTLIGTPPYKDTPKPVEILEFVQSKLDASSSGVVAVCLNAEGGIEIYYAEYMCDVHRENPL